MHREKWRGWLCFRNSNSSACVVGMSIGSPMGATKVFLLNDFCLGSKSSLPTDQIYWVCSNLFTVCCRLRWTLGGQFIKYRAGQPWIVWSGIQNIIYWHLQLMTRISTKMMKVSFSFYYCSLSFKYVTSCLRFNTVHLEGQVNLSGRPPCTLLNSQQLYWFLVLRLITCSSLTIGIITAGLKYKVTIF